MYRERGVTIWLCNKSANLKLRDTQVVIFKLMARYNKVNGFMIAIRGTSRTMHVPYLTANEYDLWVSPYIQIFRDPFFSFYLSTIDRSSNIIDVIIVMPNTNLKVFREGLPILRHRKEKVSSKKKTYFQSI